VIDVRARGLSKPRVVDAKGYLLSVRAVEDRLGVSTVTVYGLCARGELTPVRVSNAIRVEPGEVEAFKARSRQGTSRAPVVRARPSTP